MFPQTLLRIDASRKKFRKKFHGSRRKFHPPVPTVGHRRALCPPLSLLPFIGAPNPLLSSHDGVPDGVGSARPDGAEFDHIVRVKISQFEPILCDVGGGEEVVLLVLTL